MQTVTGLHALFKRVDQLALSQASVRLGQPAFFSA
jgi:hypothetical protein